MTLAALPPKLIQTDQVLGVLVPPWSQDQVARQLVLGVLDSQLAASCDAAVLPEVQFAYDGDVFRPLAIMEVGWI